MAKTINMEETTPVEVQKEVTGKTVLSFTKPTPMWATWVFRTEFCINKAALVILGGSSLINPANVKETVLWLGALDFVIWFMARGIGIDKREFENELNN